MRFESVDAVDVLSFSGSPNVSWSENLVLIGEEAILSSLASGLAQRSDRR